MQHDHFAMPQAVRAKPNSEPSLNPAIFAEQWQQALSNEPAKRILIVLRENPFGMGIRQLARAVGCHPQIVRRLIIGDRHCKAKLTFLVWYGKPMPRRKASLRLSTYGQIVAERLLAGEEITREELLTLATQALIEAEAHRSGKPSRTHLSHICHTSVTHLSHLPLPVPLKNLTDCKRVKPVNETAKRLIDYGVKPEAANDWVAIYGDAVCKAAMTLTDKHNGDIINPPGFMKKLLETGQAERYAEKQARQEGEKPADGDDEWQAIAERAERIVELAEEMGFEPSIGSDGVVAVWQPDGLLRLPTDLEEARSYLESLKAEPSDGNPDLSEAPDAPIDACSEPDNEPLTDSLTEADPFECYPFAAPSKLPPSKPRDRAERAAEIVASDQPLQPLGEPQRAYRTCPFCGRETDKFKRFERRYRDIIDDAELEEWDGVEVCYGDPASCFNILLKRQTDLLKQSLGIADLTEPKLPNPTKLPSPNEPMAQSPPEPQTSPSHSESHDCELVRCPRCGRKVPKKRIGKSGICFDCIEAELRERRLALGLAESNAKEVTNDDDQRNLDEGQALQSQRSLNLPQMWQ